MLSRGRCGPGSIASKWIIIAILLVLFTQYPFYDLHACKRVLSLIFTLAGTEVDFGVVEVRQ